MLVFCSLKGELVVIHILVLVLFSASRIVLSPETCAFLLQRHDTPKVVSLDL